MSKETTYAGKLGDWRRLLTSVLANLGQLPDLQGIVSRFEALLNRGHDLARQQAAHVAGKQETSKQLKEVISEGDRLATLVRKSLQSHFGPRAEKLAEFGVQPFRGRKPAEEPEPEPTAPPAGETTS